MADSSDESSTELDEVANNLVSRPKRTDDQYRDDPVRQGDYGDEDREDAIYALPKIGLYDPLRVIHRGTNEHLSVIQYERLCLRLIHTPQYSKPQA